MDRQHAEKPLSRTTADRASSGVSQNPKISFHISEATRDLSYRKAPQSSAPGDRPTHSATILLSKSRSSQAALVPQEHKLFLEEAYNAAVCFKMLRELNGSDALRLKHIATKIEDMARRAPNLVLETIYDYFVDNPEISNRHKFRLLHVLETVLGAMRSLEQSWQGAFTTLALENMTKSTVGPAPAPGLPGRRRHPQGCNLCPRSQFLTPAPRGGGGPPL
uniref:MROH2B-like N-terminal HEAT-repeats domain-containing protein n=1 Tax=Rousettus aegyptiacus TaxID=9407 RepID=A0A7J8C388_ROUAE|nr:hypothetical protein HJG63_013517 [Rousettus aegyptiacus]